MARQRISFWVDSTLFNRLNRLIPSGMKGHLFEAMAAQLADRMGSVEQASDLITRVIMNRQELFKEDLHDTREPKDQLHLYSESRADSDDSGSYQSE